MSNRSPFQTVLTKFRKYAFSERDKGDRFERLMQAYLRTDPKYTSLFRTVWLWNEFPSKNDFGGKDTGIDLVAHAMNGDYWAIQCKCFQEGASIDKPSVDTFLSTSSRTFLNEVFEPTSFTNRLWISTTNKWGGNAEEAIKNQNPPLTRINLHDLEEAPFDWEKLEDGIFGEQARKGKKAPFEHQKTAISKTHEYFKETDRGKLIMACGTGKTFTSLKIAEKETDGNGLVLFLVPSISLLGQTLREWYAEADERLFAVCVCSDSEITKERKNKGDTDFSSVVDLALPASTNIKSVVAQLRYIQEKKKKGMAVVFSTYHSIEVVAKAQKEIIGSDQSANPFGVFDLIVCDEAHRTTGVTIAGEDESAFVKVHDNDFIRAKKRLYMTATPRLFSDDSKSKAAQAEAVLCSMDDENLYGEEIYRIGFGEAVENDLLSDYKVLILTLSEGDVPESVQKALTNQEHEISTDDASKLIGCINALSKQVLGDAGEIKKSDPEPMRRAVAFCQTIKISKKITSTFNGISDTYPESLPLDKRETVVSVQSDHIDGSMSAPVRDEKMSWLKAGDMETGECRVLTNVRCLSEGVDVPSLDAVMFLSARNSQVDVVQSVGRVMRKSPGKKYGYIIIPVVIPVDVKPEVALNDNQRFKVVWSVLNALRAHDDRFNATINKIELNKKKPAQILVGTPDTGRGDSERATGSSAEVARQLAMQFEQLQGIVFARMVKKVGDRRYWEQWAKDVARIAERHIERINRLINTEHKHKKAFEDFLGGLRKNINPSISQGEAVEMLAQHIITQPVFEALFEGYSFVKNNPVSMSMQSMLDLLDEQNMEKDAETLQKFYDSVKKRAAGIDNAEGKQRIIIELYDRFFQTAFPKMVERLGIVYTPVEVVDFIIRSADYLLQKEFGRSLTDENIHILDPFTGTGTFMSRLLQSGLITEKDLERKYRHELHANEIVLLAYYIAAVNIENAYHDATPDPDDGIGKEKYTPFDGIVLTDTFQLGETDESERLFSDMFPKNSERVQKQKNAPLRVIMGNPPYSVGQKSANDNAQNQSYEKLENKIALTYAKETDATNKNSLYNTYIKAFRWASDRLEKENGGIIAFVTDGGWIDNNVTNGFRKCIEKEFSTIYVFNLRGNARTQGEIRRKEAGNVFDSGSRTPIAVTFLVKNPTSKNEKTTIHYQDIGDYLSRDEKLKIISNFKSIENSEMKWKKLKPDKHGDWLNKRNDVFDNFISLGDKSQKAENSFFKPFYSRGLASARDAWCYNSKKSLLEKNINTTINFYNEQRLLFQDAKKKKPELSVKSFVSFNSSKISWNRGLLNDLNSNKEIKFSEQKIKTGLYRPFFKQHVYLSLELNDMVYQIPKQFPTKELNNQVICIPAPGGKKTFTALISNCIPDLHLNGDAQCFPLYYYEKQEIKSPTLFEKAGKSEYIRRDGISDFIFKQAQQAYGKRVSKEDIFYYVYSILHSPTYRSRFANDLKKSLPRLPLVDEPKDFWAFSKAGRQLAELHINYESVPPAEGVTVKGDESGIFRVQKMRFPKKGQKDTIIYNSKITIENIPAKAYEYIVNGKSAIEWIMERYQVTIHKDSGIKNDPNDWAQEVGNERYILDLLLSVIHVSVQTVGIVEGLPELVIE